MLAACQGAGDLVLHYAAENETRSGFHVTLAFISRETKDLLRRVTLYCVDVTSDCQAAENVQLSLRLLNLKELFTGFVFSSCELLGVPFNLQRQNRIFFFFFNFMAWLFWDEC